MSWLFINRYVLHVKECFWKILHLVFLCICVVNHTVGFWWFFKNPKIVFFSSRACPTKKCHKTGPPPKTTQQNLPDRQSKIDLTIFFKSHIRRENMRNSQINLIFIFWKNFFILMQRCVINFLFDHQAIWVLNLKEFHNFS